MERGDGGLLVILSISLHCSSVHCIFVPYQEDSKNIKMKKLKEIFVGKRFTVDMCKPL